MAAFFLRCRARARCASGAAIAIATIRAETSLKASVGAFKRSAIEIMKRYRQEPITTPTIRTGMRRLPNSVSPIISAASAIVTIPVPRLVSADLL